MCVYVCIYLYMYVCVYICEKIIKKSKRMISSKVSIVVPSGKKGGDDVKDAGRLIDRTSD